jgi:molecular chaperone GrpE (heat shock protein)
MNPAPDTPPDNAPEPTNGDPIAALGFDFSAVERALSANLKGRPLAPAAAPQPAAAPEPAAPKPDATAEALGELADDMLDLLRRVTGLETGQAEVLARLEKLEAATRDGAKVQARETETIRRELTGAHAALAARAVAEAVFPVLDKLRPMRAAITPRRNEALCNQLDAILDSLAGMLRAFGFTAFEPAIGTPFDPVTMRSAGEKKGPPGVVLGVEQPGYRTKESVLRPAAVFVAPPR